jgi:phosphatidylserine/phosphatidylglycerophosphate/cardiolipin synthase-like enzyme
MAKRNSNQRSIFTTLVALVLLIIAVVVSQITGIDLVGMLTGEATSMPATPAVVQTPLQDPLENAGTPIASAPDGGAVTSLTVPQGFGAQKDFWQVFFTSPSGNSDRSTYTEGIDTQLAAAINNAQNAVDIAAYEFDNERITEAVLATHERGVTVRVVTDTQAGLEDDEATLDRLVEAGIPVVGDVRTALMHNKFVIIDGSSVWTGSWNLTVNGTYRNNNNAIMLRSRRAVENYQAEFNEMFVDQQFGPTSPENTPNPAFTQDGVPIEVYFAPEDDVVGAITRTVSTADSNIRFMAFSYTLDDITTAVLERADAGVEVQGIFESTGSRRRTAELTPLFCAGMQVRTDGGPYILHHKVFIVDDDTVLTGSFNFSANATDSNDENLLIIQDADLAAQFIAEFERRWAESNIPDDISCS